MDLRRPQPLANLAEYVEQNARFQGDATALISGTQRWSWRELAARAADAAAKLVATGIAPGDRVALLASSGPWAYECILGAWHAGAVIVPVSPLLDPAALAAVLRDAGARVLLVGRVHDALARAAIGFLPKPPARLDESAETTAPTATRSRAAELDGSSPCTIIYSSGTTGDPKGIVHSQQARVQMALHVALGLGFERGCRSVLATPPFTNGTFICLLPTIIAAGTLIVMPKFELDAFFDVVERERPTHVFLVPTMLRQMLAHPRFASTDFSCFRTIVSAGSTLPDDLKQRLLAAWGERVAELWGLTEGVASFIRGSEMPNASGSVGRPLVGTELRIIGPQGEELEGAAGEIVGRSPYLMDGYLGRADATATATWTAPDGGRYLRTGDAGELDAAGFLRLRGRIKDIIISGGLNIYPQDIESVLLQHEAVADAVVVGVPDEKWGEAPVAWVIPRAGHALDAAALMDWLAPRVARFQRVRELMVVTDVPRNVLGKPLRRELAARYRRSDAPS